MRKYYVACTGNWEAETSTENKETVDPLVISLEGISKRENYSDSPT
jgi:hypothetical protein